MQSKERAPGFTSHLLVASRALPNFLGITPGENILVLTDSNPDPNQELLAMITLAAAEILESPFCWQQLRERISPEQARDYLRNYPVIINYSIIGHRTVKLFEYLQEYGNRLASPIGATSDLFAPGGPLDIKDIFQLEEQLMRIKTLLNNAYALKVSTDYGTDLTICLKPGRQWAACSGVIKPGNWDNMTGAEVLTTPDEFSVDGTLVLLSYDDDYAQQIPVDQPLVLTFRDGIITSLQGGEAARNFCTQLRKYGLEEYHYHQRNPLNVYRCAEIGFPGTPGVWLGKSEPTAMIEKRILHLGIGSSDHGEKGVNGLFGNVVSHLDLIIPKANVIKFPTECDFVKKRHGTPIMHHGHYI